MDTRKTGAKYERIACDRLRRMGYEILEMNFSCKLGEVDIIARDEGYLVFAEVKYRKSAASGMPLEAVTVKKQKKISATAAYYLMTHGFSDDTQVRFDVVAVLGDEVSVLKNAFGYCFG